MYLNRLVCVEEAHFHCGWNLPVGSNSKRVLVMLINAIGVQEYGGTLTETHNQAINSPGKAFAQGGDGGLQDANPNTWVTFE